MDDPRLGWLRLHHGARRMKTINLYIHNRIFDHNPPFHWRPMVNSAYLREVFQRFPNDPDAQMYYIREYGVGPRQVLGGGYDMALNTFYTAEELEAGRLGQPHWRVQRREMLNEDLDRVTMSALALFEQARYPELHVTNDGDLLPGEMGRNPLVYNLQGEPMDMHELADAERDIRDNLALL